MKNRLVKTIALLLCFSLIFEQSGFAQIAGQLDIPGYLASLRSSFIQDKFRPLHLRCLSYDTLNNNFKLLLDKGDQFKGLSPQGTVPELKSATKEILKYFFIGISLPNDSFWVNLRPDPQDNIIDDYLAQTDVGKILLEADLQLKKDTAQFTSPQTPEGKKYWDKLYQKAGELFGPDNITIPTLTRPWIVPGEIIIREAKDNAYIYKATLKVMLEQDYLKDSATYNFKDPRLKALNEYSSQLIRELIIPKLTKEVNTSKRYAPLRQVYYSLILAQWFKARFYGKGGLYSYLIDKKNLTGLMSQSNWSKTAYFKEYQKSFKDGEYNVKELVSTPYGQSVRSYFSGGINLIPAEAAYPQNPPTVSSPIVTSGPYTAMYTTKTEPGGSYLLAAKADFSGASAASPAEGKVEINLTAASSPLAQPQQAKEGAVSPLLAETPESTTSSPVIKPITSSSILPSQNAGVQKKDIIEEVQETITQALVGQINNVSRGDLKGKYRVVNIGSTARQTHIFEMDSKEFDLDFMILFEEQGDLDNFLDNYSNALADTESIFRSSGLSTKHQGAGENRRGDSKILYFIKDGAREFKLEVNVSREKKIYADWFKEQEAQVVQLGGNAEFLRYEIKRMKRLVRQLGIYRLYEGGIGSVGIEQLIMQSAGASDQGRKIEGVGGFYKALDLLCDAGLDKRGEIIPWQKAKEKISIFDPETGEDFMVRLDEASWYSLVGLAKEYLSRAYRRSRDDLPVEFLGGKEQARAWAPEAVEHDSVDGYVARMRAFGSGHVAVHISDLALLPTILKKGALLPRIYTQSYADIESQASVLSYPTKFLHFIVDGFYSGEHGYRGNTVAFLAAVEPLLENKAFTFLPQQGKEWEVTGFTDSAYDESNRFYINATGILFVPADLENDQEFQKLLQSLPYQPRIHYYKAKTVQEGIADFLAQQDIKPKDSLVLSGYVEQIGTKDDNLVYAVISPWSGLNRGVEVKDVPQTAEECAVTALQLFLIPNGRGQTPEAYQLAQRAYELNPSSARANLAKGLYYSYYLESKKGKDLPTMLREKITYFEQALQLGLSQRYEIIALDRLIELYPQVFAFESQIKAIERYVRSVGITDLQRTRREQELQRTKQAKTGLERLIQRIGSCTSLNDLSQLLTDVSYLDYYMSRYAFQQFCMRLSQLLPAEFQALLQTSQERIRLEKRNPGFNAYSLRKGMIDDLNTLLNSIDNLLLASHRNLVTPFYREDREFQQDANEYFEDGYRIVKEWRSDFQTRIDTELQRAEREAELWHRLRWDITTLFENTVNAEINRQDAKSAHQYYNAIRRDIRRLSGDKSWQELQEMGVDTSELRVQITRLIEQAEVKIDAALKELEKRGFIKKAVDRMQPNIRIPKDYKTRRDFQFIPPGSESIVSSPARQQGDQASSPTQETPATASPAAAHSGDVSASGGSSPAESKRQMSLPDYLTKRDTLSLLRKLHRVLGNYREDIKIVRALVNTEGETEEFLLRSADIQMPKSEQERVLQDIRARVPERIKAMGEYLSQMDRRGISLNKQREAVRFIADRPWEVFALKRELLSGVVDITQDLLREARLRQLAVERSNIMRKAFQDGRFDKNVLIIEGQDTATGRSEWGVTYIVQRISDRYYIGMHSAHQWGPNLNYKVYKRNNGTPIGTVYPIGVHNSFRPFTPYVGITQGDYDFAISLIESNELLDVLPIMQLAREKPVVTMVGIKNARLDTFVLESKPRASGGISIVSRATPGDSGAPLVDIDDHGNFGVRGHISGGRDLSRFAAIFSPEILQELRQFATETDEFSQFKIIEPGFSRFTSIVGESASDFFSSLTVSSSAPGQMKPLGLRDLMDEDRELDLSSRHPELETLAASTQVADVDRIQARVIRADLGNAGAHHFKSEKGLGFIIVVNSRHPQIYEEGKFHEAKEIFWMSRGFSQHEAHVIASAEQIKRFSVNDQLTPYHVLQLQNMTGSQQEEIQNENQEARQWHHDVLERANAHGAGIGILKIQQYEDKLRAQADRLAATQPPATKPAETSPLTHSEREMGVASQGGEKELSNSSVNRLVSRRSLATLQDDRFENYVYKVATAFLKSLGAREGSRIVNIGSANDYVLPLSAALLGVHYIAYELRQGFYEDVIYQLSRYELEEHGGSARQIWGEFSSKPSAQSQELEGHSQDIVLILTGALSDPTPESEPEAVLNEALRVIKPGGRIVVGSFSRTWESHEKQKAIELISRVLTMSQWQGKVELMPKGNVEHSLTTAVIYEVNFIASSDDSAGGSASSPLTPGANKALGGVDFRSLPILTQPVPLVTFRDSPLQSRRLDERGQSLSNVNLDTEWRQIESMLKAGIIPSSERIREYLEACSAKEDMNKEIDKVLACIADILRLEEERCQITEAGLKEILVLLESDKPFKDMQHALINIMILPKETAIKP